MMLIIGMRKIATKKLGMNELIAKIWARLIATFCVTCLIYQIVMRIKLKHSKSKLKWTMRVI